jgi:hypothetical protein
VIGAPTRAPKVEIGEITLLKAVPGACETRVGAPRDPVAEEMFAVGAATAVGVPRDPVAEEMFAVGAATAVGAGAADIACKF